MADIYKRAAQLNVRFASPQGLLTLYDLFKIPLEQSSGNANLDDIYKTLNKKLRENNDNDSLINPKKSTDEKLQLAFDVVRDVIETRLAERDEKSKEQERAAERQKIMEAIAKKKDQRLDGMPLEELEKLLEK